MKANLIVAIMLVYSINGYATLTSRLSSIYDSAGDSVYYIYTTSARGSFKFREINFYDGQIPLKNYSATSTLDKDQRLPGIVPYDTAYTYTYTGSEWVFFKREYHAFDTHNNIIEYTEQFYDSTVGWQDAMKDSFIYNSDNYIIEHVSKVWNTSIGNWLYTEKDIFSYDGSNVDTFTMMLRRSSSWENYLRAIFSYDSHNRIAEILMNNNWDDIANKWIDSSREMNYYNSGGNIDSVLWYNKTPSGWTYMNEKEQCQYTGYDRTMLRFYDSTLISEQDSSRYDINHNKISSFISKHYFYSPTLLPFMSYWLAYDSLNRPINCNITSPSISHNIVYHYDSYEDINSVPPNSFNISIYPNPSSGNFCIRSQQPFPRGATVAVYNAIGQQVYQTKNIPANGILDLILPSGMYVLKYTTDKEYAVKQLIIER